MLQPGTILDNKYRIQAAIGRGGFGHVYRARDLLTGEMVAIKELIPALVGDPRMVQRFIQEARATLRLTHPNIARTHSIFQEGDTYYLSMEHLPGGTLADRLEHGALPIEEAIRIVAELAAALDYAHGEGVVHNDVKPGNVLFDAGGGAHLADFGIANVSSPAATRPLLPATGPTFGTLDYMAPEQLDGVRDDPRSDVYALGALLYEMLAGRPYLDLDPDMAPAVQARNAQRIRREPPRPLREAGAAGKVPEWLARVVDRALRKDPQQRFATAAALGQALQPGVRTTVPLSVQTERPVPAADPEPPLPVRTAPLPRRAPRSAPAAGEDRMRRPAAGSARNGRPLGEWLVLGCLAFIALAVIGGLGAAALGLRLSRAAAVVDGPGPATPTPEIAWTTPLPTAPGSDSPPDPTAGAPATTAAPTLLPDTGTMPDNGAREQELLARVRVRPNGEPVFAYRAPQPPTIDGSLDEWAGRREYAIEHVIHQPENWQGPDDLSGAFQVAWDDQYLYLAVRVRDDQHVQVPGGNRLYLGDDVELQIDADLAGDFDHAALSDDDGQLGLAARDLAAGPYEAYLWRPPALEGPRDVAMAFRPEAGGYTLEAAVPWAALREAWRPQGETPYGFALSLSDADTPGAEAQESMASHVPNRLWDNPTTWGTIILVNW